MARTLEQLALHYLVELAEGQREWSKAVRAAERLCALQSEIVGEKRSGDLVGDPAESAEKLACLYWRAGKRDKATSGFTQWLERWPDHVRATLIKRAVISLEMADPLQEGDMACLLWPLPSYGSEAVSPAAGIRSPASTADLPAPPQPGRQGLDRLVNSLAPDDGWAGVLMAERGWMLWEADQLPEAKAEFTRAAAHPQQLNSLTRRTVEDYAELSKALIALQEGRISEARTLAGEVAARRPGGHAQTLAESIMINADQRRNQVGNVGRCGVKTLD